MENYLDEASCDAEIGRRQLEEVLSRSKKRNRLWGKQQGSSYGSLWSETLRFRLPDLNMGNGFHQGCDGVPASKGEKHS